MEWDALKNQWCSFAVPAGRARRGRVSVELNRILWRLRLVQRGGSTTLLMREYMAVLCAQYSRLLAHSSTTAGAQRLNSAPVTHPEVLRPLRVLGAGAAVEVPRALLGNNSYITSPSLVVSFSSCATPQV